MKILFVINNLNIGGAEKALVNLLNSLDYSKYEVDLLLFKKVGHFLTEVPNEVNILPVPTNYHFFDSSIVNSLKTLNLNLIWSRYRFAQVMDKAPNPAQAEQFAWPYLSRSLAALEKEYDVAIGYLEKNPNYYVIDKVKAKKKIGFVHTDYKEMGFDVAVDYMYFDKLDAIASVSSESVFKLKEIFPKFSSKIHLVPNFTSEKAVNLKKVETVSEFDFEFNKCNIVTVARLESPKGIFTSIEVARKLLELGFSFRWYVFGEGSQRSALEALIEKYHLIDIFILAGSHSNPIKFMHVADVIVQTSVFEGKSIVLDEAKMLCKPIIVTNYPTAKDQIEHMVNGLIVGFDPEVIANEIIKLYFDKDLQEALQMRLKEDIHDASNYINSFNRLLQ